MEKRESKRRLQSLHLIRENSSARDKEKNIPSLLFSTKRRNWGQKKSFSSHTICQEGRVVKYAIFYLSTLWNEESFLSFYSIPTAELFVTIRSVVLRKLIASIAFLSRKWENRLSLSKCPRPRDQ